MTRHMAGLTIGLHGPGSPVADRLGSAMGAGACSSVVDGLPLNGAVDGGPSDIEQLGKLARGMRACEVDLHQVPLLRQGQLRLFAA